VQLVRRITSETSVELKILSEKWRLLLAGVIFQVNISRLQDSFPTTLPWDDSYAFPETFFLVVYSTKLIDDQLGMCSFPPRKNSSLLMLLMM
jgi:hypothetical protein